MAESPKTQLLRDFRRRSIFDFYNKIGTFETCCRHGECLFIGEYRKWRARGQTGAIDPTETWGPTSF